jgi:predicted nucleic acid-binding protein
MGMNEAVLDAGPFIHLAELQVLEILADIPVIYVPHAVWDEIQRYQPSTLATTELKLERTSPEPLSHELQTLAGVLVLDHGEIAALALMEKKPDAIFLTDDAAARLAATQLGYRVHGTIGLLIRAVRRRLKPPGEILTILRSLPERSTLYIRQGLLAEIIGQLEREWEPGKD